jgi:hypothetical protein
MKLLRATQLFLLFTTLFVAFAPAQTPNFPSGAQQISHSLMAFPVYTLNAAPVPGASLQVVGASGQASYCYWAVANYNIGSVLSGLGCVNNSANTLSVSNYNAITPWVYPGSVNSVDILRTTGPVALAPSGACNCAVATGVTSGTVNDQSASLNSYTVTLFNPLSFALSLTNEVTGVGASHLILRQGWPYPGTQVADLSNIGASGITGSGTNGTFAGFTGTSSIGNTPCVFTTTSVTCTVAQTSPSGNETFSLFGGPFSGIASSWKLCDQQTFCIYDYQPAGSGTGTTTGVDVTIGSAGAFVIAGAVNLFSVNISGPSVKQTVISQPLQANGNGAASEPGLALFGSTFTGGTGTTTYPFISVLPTGATAVTTWSTNGTVFGVNEVSGFTGNLFDFRINGGAQLWGVNSAGLTNAVGGYQQNGTSLGLGCGTTTTCANTAEPLDHIVRGNAPLVSGTPSVAAVTGISPAFTSTSTYDCTVSNDTTQANPVKVTKVSGSAVTFTGPNTVTDVVSYICVGS